MVVAADTKRLVVFLFPRIDGFDLTDCHPMLQPDLAVVVALMV